MSIIYKIIQALFPRWHAIWSADCKHAQAVFINVSSIEQLKPYADRICKRGTCISCGKELGELSFVRLPGIGRKGAIDLSQNEEEIKRTAVAEWGLHLDDNNDGLGSLFNVPPKNV